MVSSGSGHPLVSAALGRMAVLRQADASEAMLDLYSAELAAEGLDPELVVDACEQLGRAERAEFEPAFPTLGTLLRECHAAEYRRHRRRQLALAAQAPTEFLLPETTNTTPLTREEARARVVEFRAAVEAKRQERA